MNGAVLEALLARLYSDAELLGLFMEEPRRVAQEAGLDEEATRAMLSIDRNALAMAAGSYASKRASRSSRQRRNWPWRT